MAGYLRTRAYQRWCDLDKEILTALNTWRFSAKAIGEVLQRSPQAVYAMKKKLGAKSVLYYRDSVTAARNELQTSEIIPAPKPRLRKRAG